MPKLILKKIYAINSHLNTVIAPSFSVRFSVSNVALGKPTIIIDGKLISKLDTKGLTDGDLQSIACYRSSRLRSSTIFMPMWIVVDLLHIYTIDLVDVIFGDHFFFLGKTPFYIKKYIVVRTLEC